MAKNDILNGESCRELVQAPPVRRSWWRSKLPPIDGTHATNTLLVRASPADISFFRTRIYYGRPLSLRLSDHSVRHASDVLNRIDPSYFRKPKASPETWVDPDPRTQAEDARYLSKYIFPRQYGLSSPFMIKRQQYERYSVPDYADREQEIQVPNLPFDSLIHLPIHLQSQGACKTPKRLKESLKILQRMVWKHGKCGYKPLRDKFCPSKEMMSEDSSMLFSQLAQLDTSMDTSGYEASLGVIDQAKPKPKFAEFACSYVEVYRYVAAITHCVIPKAFWGNEANYRLIMRRELYEFVTHMYSHWFRPACEWLMPPGEKAQSRGAFPSRIRSNAASYSKSSCSGTSTVSYCRCSRNKTLYFRQDDWETLCAPLLEKLTSTTFKQIPDVRGRQTLKSYFANANLGSRYGRAAHRQLETEGAKSSRTYRSTALIIYSLTREPGASKGAFSGPEKSINQILQAAFHILSYEKETYLLQRYGKVSSFTGKIERRYMKRAVPDGDHGPHLCRFVLTCPTDDQPHFLRYATELASCLRGTIFSDQVVYPHAKQNDILQLLEEHITENIVKVSMFYYDALKILHVTCDSSNVDRSHYYQQTVGIPQGSILSTLLCSFFYGDMEKRFPAAVSEGEDSVRVL
ncbi:telomerase reverse transcriptase [Salix suchowensis]|nr:telomerase reverse transcriptase [Salix suchowensis]